MCSYSLVSRDVSQGLNPALRQHDDWIWIEPTPQYCHRAESRSLISYKWRAASKSIGQASPELT